MTFPPAAVDALMEFVLYDVLKKQISAASLPIDVSAILGRVSQNLPNVCTKAEEEAVAWLRQRGVTVGGSGPSKAASDEESSEGEVSGKQEAVTSGWTVADMTDVDLRKSSWRSAKKFATHFKKTKVSSRPGPRAFVCVEYVIDMIVTHKSRLTACRCCVLFDSDSYAPMRTIAVRPGQKEFDRSIFSCRYGL